MKQNKKLVLFAVCPACYSLFMEEVFCVKGELERIASFSWWAARYEPQANKSFSVQQFFKNAAEAWASSPHLRSKSDFATCFPCCNCIFWNCPIQTKLNHENQGCKFRQGNGAIAARWQAKAGVEPPFAGWERPFSLRVEFSIRHVPLQLFHRNSCKITDYC